LVFHRDHSHLAHKHPFPYVEPAKYLKHDAFDPSCDKEEYEGNKKQKVMAMTVSMMLSPGAASEVAFRLPYSILPSYVRALRLEERYESVEAVLSSLEDMISKRGNEMDRDGSKSEWLKQEREKVTFTRSARDAGDDFFRTSKYEQAAEEYTRCLSVDSKSRGAPNDGVACAGGRLHTVLHCSRALCHMHLDNYREAIADASSALCIQTRYTKALAVRGMSSMHLNRHDEAISDFEAWSEMAEDWSAGGRKDDDGSWFVDEEELYARVDDTAKIDEYLKDCVESKKEAEEMERVEQRLSSEGEEIVFGMFADSESDSGSESDIVGEK